MINQILFATDLGVCTPYCLMHVEALAVKFDANINIVHVVPPLEELAAAVVRSHCSDLVKQEVLNTPHIKGLLESLKETIFETLLREPFDDSRLLERVMDISVLAGQPANVVLDVADKLQSDLIVIGSQGVNNLDGRLLGSVAARILQLSRRPVYMIPVMDRAHVYGTQYGAPLERPKRA